MARNCFLYRIRPAREEMLTSGPSEVEATVIDEHFNYLDTLTQSGVVYLAGRTLTTDSDGMGIVIIFAEDEDQAAEIMKHDPAVLHGVMTARLFPFRIALSADATLKHDSE